MHDDEKLKGTVWVLVCVVLWAFIPVVSKMGQNQLDNHQFLFWSSLVSFSVLFAAVVLKGQIKLFLQISFRKYLYLAVLGLLGTYIYYLFLYLGYARAGGMEVLVIQYSWPILIVILSLFILRERLTFTKIIAILCGFSGVIIVLSKGKFKDIHFENLQVILLVLLGAFCFALFSVLSKTVHIDPIVANTVYFGVAAIASYCSMLYFSSWKLPVSSEMMPVLMNGIFVNGFSYVFWIFALRSTSASYIAPFTYLTPVLSAIYLVLFFQEPFLFSYAAGLILVLAGGLINTVDLNGFLLKGKRI